MIPRIPLTVWRLAWDIDDMDPSDHWFHEFGNVAGNAEGLENITVHHESTQRQKVYSIFLGKRNLTMRGKQMFYFIL